MSSVTIYHNPRCSTSRTVLGMLREAGVEVEVIDYLQAGWTEKVLRRLIAGSSGGAQGLLRAKEPLARELNLAEAPEAAVLEAMIDNPVLVERPIVESGGRAVVCRPPERVWEVAER